MKNLLLLTDYKGFFSSKYASVPYRSGMNKSRLSAAFAEHGYQACFKMFHEIDFRDHDFSGMPVVYSSSEDYGGHYKDYIEDIVWGLHMGGAFLIPKLEYFRAHHNKVFMEILRDLAPVSEIKGIRSHHVGTIEDLLKESYKLTFPCVIKKAASAASLGVRLARSSKELKRLAARMGRTVHLWNDLWDLGRSLRHRGYVRDSLHRRKIIVQNFVENLRNDWKVLIFGDQYYILFRHVRQKDFRASGSGLFDFEVEMPEQLLSFAATVFDALKTPCGSLDIAYDGSNFYLIEFQCLHFGTYTLDASPFYYLRHKSGWQKIYGGSELEDVYATSIANFLNKNNCVNGVSIGYQGLMNNG